LLSSIETTYKILITLLIHYSTFSPLSLVEIHHWPPLIGYPGTQKNPPKIEPVKGGFLKRLGFLAQLHVHHFSPQLVSPVPVLGQAEHLPVQFKYGN
jgi:hypothetical protein